MTLLSSIDGKNEKLLVKLPELTLLSVTNVLVSQLRTFKHPD